MMPSSPIRGRSRAVSALSVDVVVAVIERIDVLLIKRHGIPQLTSEVDRARSVLAHHRGLDGVARPGPEREDAMRAHEHGGRAVAGERLDDAAADPLVADQRKRPDGNLTTE